MVSNEQYRVDEDVSEPDEEARKQHPFYNSSDEDLGLEDRYNEQILVIDTDIHTNNANDQEILAGSEEVSRVANTFPEEVNKENSAVDQEYIRQGESEREKVDEVRLDWRQSDNSTSNLLTTIAVEEEMVAEKITSTPNNGASKETGANSIYKKMENISMGGKKGRPRLRCKKFNNPFDLGICRKGKRSKKKQSMRTGLAKRATNIELQYYENSVFGNKKLNHSKQALAIAETALLMGLEFSNGT